MYDAIVLAGGAARRLDGAAKPQLAVGGSTLLDRVVDAVADAGRIVVVGPRQPVAVEVRWTREEPIGGGPVVALAAGLLATSARVVVVLAADLPWIAGAVPRLVTAVPPAGMARLRDGDGRANHLAAAWDRAALVDALDRLGTVHGASMRALTAGVPAVDVEDAGGWGRDCDTWADLDRARTEIGR